MNDSQNIFKWLGMITGRVDSLMEDGRFDDALRLLAEAGRKRRGVSQIRKLRIKVLSRSGRTRRAINEYLKLIESVPGEVDDYHLDSVEEILEGAINDRRWEIRAFIVARISQICGRRFKGLYFKAFADENEWVQGDAALGCGYLGDPDFIPPLKRLANGHNYFVSLCASNSLKKNFLDDKGNRIVCGVTKEIDGIFEELGQIAEKLGDEEAKKIIDQEVPPPPKLEDDLVDIDKLPRSLREPRICRHWARKLPGAGLPTIIEGLAPSLPMEVRLHSLMWLWRMLSSR